mmetsp:Transcript_17557/g.45220  ORF Transcript_17557/g.45220 Transcript_17557/m.45220 type:complete len:251 (+) Transcript_17557:67-819(+)
MSCRHPVTLHVYTIGYGAYHAAVEVRGEEWEYGAGGGIQAIRPGGAANNYNGHEAYRCGSTPFDKKTVRGIIDRMKPVWHPNAYELVGKNCCHFARQFLLKLEAETMPDWVDTWSYKVAPTLQAGVEAVGTRGAVLAGEAGVRAAMGAVSASAGPAAWAAAAGDLVGSSIGARVGGAVAGADGAEVGQELGSFGGSLGAGAGVGFCVAGPVGAGVGAGVGFLSWGFGKVIQGVTDTVLKGAATSSTSSTS